MAKKRSSKRIRGLQSKSKHYIGKNQMPLQLLMALDRTFEKTTEHEVRERLKQVYLN